MGTSIGSPIVASNYGIPRVIVINSRSVDPSDEEVEIIPAPPIISPSATVLASRVAKTMVSGLGHPSRVLGRALTASGVAVAPPSLLGPRESKGSLAQGRVGTSSAHREAKVPAKSPDHQTFIYRERVDGRWIYQISTGEGDLALHNSMVARGLS